MATDVSLVQRHWIATAGLTLGTLSQAIYHYGGFSLHVRFSSFLATCASLAVNYAYATPFTADRSATNPLVILVVTGGVATLSVDYWCGHVWMVRVNNFITLFCCYYAVANPFLAVSRPTGLTKRTEAAKSDSTGPR